jgi:hypothetical protein
VSPINFCAGDGGGILVQSDVFNRLLSPPNPSRARGVLGAENATLNKSPELRGTDDVARLRRLMYF